MPGEWNSTRTGCRYCLRACGHVKVVFSIARALEFARKNLYFPANRSWSSETGQLRYGYERLRNLLVFTDNEITWRNPWYRVYIPLCGNRESSKYLNIMAMPLLCNLLLYDNTIKLCYILNHRNIYILFSHTRLTESRHFCISVREGWSEESEFPFQKRVCHILEVGISNVLEIPQPRK